MDQILDSSPDHSPERRIAVIGNSNSAMSVSFVYALADEPNFSVTNWSIGATPNVILLDFLAHEVDFDYDFIIIETAVCDFTVQTYTSERSRETLELFITNLRLISNAEIVMLTIPTRYGLLEPELHWQEQLYREVAGQFGIPILDGFALVRQLVGLPKMEQISIYTRRAKSLISLFGLPSTIFHSFVWRSLRDSNFSPNALAIFGFADHAHFAAPLHALAGSLFREFLRSRATNRRDGFSKKSDAGPSVVVESQPVGSRYILRKSTLISRNLVALSAGEVARYQCPLGYRAVGLLLNSTETIGVLSVQSPAGNTTLNCSFGPQPHPWIAMIVPILDAIGDGDIEMTIMPGTPPGHSKGVAELGELILVKTDWREILPVIRGDTINLFQIEDAPWAKPIIADAAARANNVALGIEAETHMVDKAFVSFAADLLGTTAPLSNADRARLMVMIGMTEQLPGFLDAACAEQTGDIELETMRVGLRAVRAEDNAPPEGILRRAIDLARSGAVDQSDALLEEGMARFMGRLDLFSEWARNASQRKNWPEALRRWKLIQSMFPKNALGYIGSASSLKEMGRLVEAADLLARAAEMFPDDAGALIELAWFETRRSAWEVAAGLWEAVRERFPHFSAGYVGGAIVYHELGRFEDADNVITAGRNRLPDDRDTAFWWADLAVRRFDWPEAARRWLILRNVFPTEMRCTLDAARALTEAGEPGQADALIAEAQEHFPHDARLASQWADAADERSDWPAAAEQWKRVRECFPTESRAYKHEIRAREKLGQLDTAEDLARNAVAVFPNHVDVLLQAGAIAVRCGELVTGAERYAAACSLDRENPDAARRYVETLISLDWRADAAIVLDNAISKWPRNEFMVRSRIACALHAKLFTDALEVWRRSLRDWGEDRSFPSAMAALIVESSPPNEDLQTLRDFLYLGSDVRDKP